MTLSPWQGSSVIEAVCAIALFVGLEWLSFLHDHDGLPVTPWNPGLGLMLALIIIRGPAFAGVLFVGELLAELIVLRTKLPLHVVVAVGLIVAASYGGVAVVLRRYLRLDTSVLHARDSLLLFAGGVAGAVVVAASLCFLLLTTRHFDVSDIARAAAPMVLGDVIGIAVTTPLILRLHRNRDLLRSMAMKRVLEFVLFSFAMLLILVVTLGPGASHPQLFYMLFLPVTLLAMRHGIDGACGGLTIVQLLLVAILHFYGFDLLRFTEYQLLMLALTLTGLVVGALVSERQIADEAARAAQEKLQALQLEAARAARFNLVSGMAAALAHEVNQPLTAARALSRAVQQLLRKSGGDTARIDTNVTGMIEQIDHAAMTVRRMREFLQRGEPQSASVDLTSVATDAAALMRPLTRMHRIQLHLDLPDDVPPVLADRVQIQQVIVNLVRNAIDAIVDSGRPDGWISISIVQPVAKDEIQICVRDNGPGLDSEQVRMLFDPLQTTKAEGLGLGLSICKSIVEAHGGRIWLESGSGNQTEFRFSLPMRSEAAASYQS